MEKQQLLEETQKQLKLKKTYELKMLHEKENEEKMQKEKENEETKLR